MPIPVRVRPISTVGSSKSTLTRHHDDAAVSAEPSTGACSLVPTSSNQNTKEPGTTNALKTSERTVAMPGLARDKGQIEASLPKTGLKGTASSTSRNAKPPPSNSHQTVTRETQLHGQRSAATRFGHIRARSDLTPVGNGSSGIIAQRSDATNRNPVPNTYQHQGLQHKNSRPASNRDQEQAEPLPRPSNPNDSNFSRLQNELFQLSLVHQASWRTLKEYKTSADRGLLAREKALQEEDLSLSAAEEEHQAAFNMAALQTWLLATSSDSQDDQITVLCTCIRQLTELSSRNGIFETAIADFERWQADLSTAPALGTSLITPINPNWLHTVSGLERQLRVCQRCLSFMGQPDMQSGFGMILDGHRTLASSMLEEIATSRDIYNLVTKREAARISETLESAIEELRTGQPISSTPRRPVWDEMYTRIM